MSKLGLAGLALIGLVACGGKSAAKPPAAPAARRAAAPRTTTTSTRTQHRTTARPDTAGQTRNPLTGH